MSYDACQEGLTLHPTKPDTQAPRTIEACKSKNGALNFSIDGKSLHSRINPQREAERFVRASVALKDPSALLILGESAGHLIHAAKLLFPSAKILAIYPEFHREFHVPLSKDRVLFSHEEPAIESFLAAQVLPFELSELTVVEWRPTLDAYEEAGSAIREAVRAALTVLQRNVHTTMHFGRRWLRNIVRNYLMIDEYLSIGRIVVPVLVVASGPSLHSSLDFIRKHKNRLFILATSSAFLCLRHNNIQPDALVHVDGGYWASRYLQDAECPVVTTLSAALGSKSSALLFSQNSLLEQRFPSPAQHVVPEHGTVAGSAFWLGMQLGTGPVIMAGLDLRTEDILSHARPHAFDRIYTLRSTRLSPEEHLRYAHTHELIEGKSLSLYAAWFSHIASRLDEGSLYLLPESLFQGNIPRYDPSLLPTHTKHVSIARRKAPPREQRRKTLRAHLGNLRSTLDSEQREAQDLLLHLCPKAWRTSKRRIRSADREQALAELDELETRYLR